MKWIRAAGLLVLSVLAVVALQAAVVADGPQGTLSESSRVFIQPRLISVEEGETFTVSVMVENAQDMISYGFEMDWDSSVLTVTDVTDAGFLLKPPTELFEPSAGTLSFNAFAPPPNEDGADGDGTLAVMTLRAMGQGLSKLKMHHVEWYHADDPASPHVLTVGQGTVVVDGAFVYLPLVLRNYGP